MLVMTLRSPMTRYVAANDQITPHESGTTSTMTARVERNSTYSTSITPKAAAAPARSVSRLMMACSAALLMYGPTTLNDRSVPDHGLSGRSKTSWAVRRISSEIDFANSRSAAGSVGCSKMTLASMPLRS